MTSRRSTTSARAVSEQAASFRGDQEVQNFVELEAGGTTAFHEMFASGRYQPFQWYVRHFREGEARETKLYFTPRGEPYGFVVKLPEKEVGAALEADQAQAIAERGAGDWKVDLAKFELVEKSRDVRPGGRVDHTFVYERPDVKIGDGRYRLRLVVGGDRLTTLQHFVKVPEAFGRRFEEMRSANNGISIISVVGLVLVYLIGGCGVGLFILGRERWIIWRTPVIWGVFVAFLQLLEGINQWPLTWLDYDTAVSSGGFVAQQVGMQLLTFVGYAFLFSVSFMAAESLTRRAFPERLQLWKLWSPNVSASKTMLGQTAAGYLLAAVFFGYEVLFYFLASRGLGWWMPSDTLVQPDVLASYQPWFSAIAVSTQAGFWEEAMFRAVPLACAALLGQRFGRRGWWIAGTLILQAVIFGSGHAGYANQPAYARVVELIVPSLMFGGLYLVFGLWPGIVLHFGYDVAMFAIPVFVTSAPGAWADRMMVILLVLVPLWIVIGGRRRAGAWTEAAAGDRNAAWQPPPKETAAKEATVTSTTVHPLVVRGLAVAGVIGLALWAFFAHFTHDAPPLDVGRVSAEQTARQALAERGVTLDSRWRALPELDGSPAEPHNFVWRTAGREAYHRLLGQFMAPPRWTVRFARFTGDVAERAEEYHVMVGAGGKVTGVRHLLPEDKAAPSMAEADARALALQTLRERFNFEPAMLKEVEAKPSKLKSRTDWLFTFTVRTEPPLKEGETRATVSIAGNDVNAAGRFVFIPEEWARAERDRQTMPNMINLACIALIALAAVGGIIVGIVNWVRRRFSLRTFLVMAPLLLVVNVAARFNQWPRTTAAFSTAQPYELQLIVAVVGLAIGLTALALGVAVLGGYVTRARQRPLLAPVDRLTTGVSVALAGGRTRRGRGAPDAVVRAVVAGLRTARVVRAVGRSAARRRVGVDRACPRRMVLHRARRRAHGGLDAAKGAGSRGRDGAGPRGGGVGRDRVAAVVGRLGHPHRHVRPGGLRLRLSGGAGSPGGRDGRDVLAQRVQSSVVGRLPGCGNGARTARGGAVGRGVAAAVPMEGGRRPASSGAGDTNGAGLRELSVHVEQPGGLLQHGADDEDAGGEEAEGRPERVEDEAAGCQRRPRDVEYEQHRADDEQAVELAAGDAPPHERRGRSHVARHARNHGRHRVGPSQERVTESALQEDLLARGDALVVEDADQRDDDGQVPDRREAREADRRECVPEIERVPDDGVEAGGPQFRCPGIGGAPLRRPGRSCADGNHPDEEPRECDRERRDLPDVNSGRNRVRQPGVQQAQQEQRQQQQRELPPPPEEPGAGPRDLVEELHVGR